MKKKLDNSGLVHRSGRKIFVYLTVFTGIIACSIILLPACEDEVPTVKDRGFSGRIRPGTSSIEARAKARRAAEKDADKGEDKARQKGGIDLAELSDESFVEVPSRRNPFRSFEEIFTTKKILEENKSQRNVILGEYSINSLRLMAIVTGVGNPRAMLLDPKGKGHIIRRGDYMGRDELVERPDSEGGDIQINWRVSRIMGEGKEVDRGIWLVRDDPTAPKEGQVTKFVPLHPDTQI